MASFEGVLAGVPGLAGQLAKRRYNEDSTLNELKTAGGAVGLMGEFDKQREAQQIRGILSQSDMPIDRKLQALTQAGPTGVQLAGVLSKQQHEIDKNAFFSPAGQAPFMRGGRPADTPVPEEAGGVGPVRPAVAPTLDFPAMLQAAASRNFVPPEAYANHLAQRDIARATLTAAQQNRMDMLIQRETESQRRSEDTRLGIEARAQGERDKIEARRDLAAFAASLRQPKNTQYVNTAQGIMRDEGGTLVPVLGPDGKQLMPSAGVSTANNQSISLANQYNNHPPVKQYNTVAPAVKYAAQYMASVPANGATAADDAALTKLYVAMTHPKGDQISNMDMKQLSMQPDLPSRVSVAVSGFINGKKLDDSTRKEFWNTISGKFKAMDSERGRKRTEVESRAREMGLNPNAIFGTE